MSFWLWHSRKGRIKDLKAPELATAATKMLQKMGRNTLSARLLYRTLQLDPFEPQALLTLSELYRGKTKGARPTGDEIYAGIILEFATDFKSPLSVEQRRLFEKPRSEIMDLWGFTKLRGDEMEVDHLGYMTFIVEESLSQVGSVPKGVQVALTKLALSAGILDPSKQTPTRLYKQWLHSDAAVLERSTLV